MHVYPEDLHPAGHPLHALDQLEVARADGRHHLGVETESAAEVEAAEARLAGDGLETTGIDDTICCYASKVETWVTDPDGARWEWYVKTGDTVLVVCTLDSYNAQSANIALDMPSLGADWTDTLVVHDEVGGATFHWGQFAFVRLEPWRAVAHILTITRPR